MERRDGQVSASRRSSVAGLYVDCCITCSIEGMICTLERPSGQMVTDDDHEPSQLFPTTLVMTHCVIHPGGYYTPVTTSVSLSIWIVNTDGTYDIDWREVGEQAHMIAMPFSRRMNSSGTHDKYCSFNSRSYRTWILIDTSLARLNRVKYQSC